MKVQCRAEFEGYSREFHPLAVQDIENSTMPKAKEVIEFLNQLPDNAITIIKNGMLVGLWTEER